MAFNAAEMTGDGRNWAGVNASCMPPPAQDHPMSPSSHAFLSSTPILGATILDSFRTTTQVFTVQNGRDGGAAWIKKAMGPEYVGGGDDSPTERLADIWDKELSNNGSTSLHENEDPGINVYDSEILRFAKLFQLSLENVGKKLQAATLEATQLPTNLKDANADAEDTKSRSEEGGIIERLKSPEERQLWALIDMMVQSKTRIKLHMGSLGRKGEFR